MRISRGEATPAAYDAGVPGTHEPRQAVVIGAGPGGLACGNPLSGMSWEARRVARAAAVPVPAELACALEAA